MRSSLLRIYINIPLPICQYKFLNLIIQRVEKIKFKFLHADRLRESEINFVFCERVLVLSTCYETVHCTVSPKFTREFGATCLLCFAQFTPPSKRRKAPKMARARCPCHFSNPSECNKLHPPPFAREAKKLIYIIRRGLAALSKFDLLPRIFLL